MKWIALTRIVGKQPSFSCTGNLPSWPDTPILVWMLRVPVLGGFFLSLGRGENGKCTGNETVFLAGQSGQDRFFSMDSCHRNAVPAWNTRKGGIYDKADETGVPVRSTACRLPRQNPKLQCSFLSLFLLMVIPGAALTNPHMHDAKLYSYSYV